MLITVILLSSFSSSFSSSFFFTCGVFLALALTQCPHHSLYSACNASCSSLSSFVGPLGALLTLTSLLLLVLLSLGPLPASPPCAGSACISGWASPSVVPLPLRRRVRGSTSVSALPSGVPFSWVSLSSCPLQHLLNGFTSSPSSRSSSSTRSTLSALSSVFMSFGLTGFLSCITFGFPR